jgi:Calcium binding
MPPARQADAELDTLIEEITVDAYDQDEQLMGFENAFDEDASFPCSGTVVGEEDKCCPSAEATTATS